MENLKNKTESSDESKVDDAFYSRDGEISELESLIPEIQEKIQDTKDMKVQSENDQEQTGFKSKFIYFPSSLRIFFLKLANIAFP